MIKNQITYLEDNTCIIHIFSETYGHKEVLMDTEDLKLFEGFDTTIYVNFDKRDNRFECKFNKPLSKGKQQNIKLHRFLMSAQEGQTVDHINRNTFDNKRANLRFLSSFASVINRGKQKKATSKYRGVCWHKRANKWVAEIRINGKSKHIGYFLSELDAAIAYAIAFASIYGFGYSENSHQNYLKI